MKKIFLISLSLFLLGMSGAKPIFAQSANNGVYFCQGNICKNTCKYGYESNCIFDIVVGQPERQCRYPTFDYAQPCIPAAYENVNGKDCVNTALGCIPVSNPNDLVGFVLGWALGIAGGIAFLLIIVASFIIITSSGDPKKVQGGKELLTAAIAGLILIIFSTFILRIIGVNILGIFP